MLLVYYLAPPFLLNTLLLGIHGIYIVKAHFLRPLRLSDSHGFNIATGDEQGFLST